MRPGSGLTWSFRPPAGCRRIANSLYWETFFESPRLVKIRFFNQYLNLPIAILAVFETLLVAASPAVQELGFRDQPFSALLADWPKVIVFVACEMIALTAMGLYNSRQRARTAGLIMRAVVASLLALVLVMVVSFFAEPLHPAPTQLIAWAAIALVFVCASRIIEGALIDEDAFKRRVLVYGAGQRAQSLSQLRRRADQRGFLVIGYLPAPGEDVLVEKSKVLENDLRELRNLAGRLEVDEIVVAMDDRRREFPVRELLDCRLNGLEIIDIVSFLERETGRLHLDVLNPSWIIFAEGFRRDALRQATKRAFDMLASLCLVLVTWPVMLITIAAIAAEDGVRAPFLYRQRRFGLDGKVFDVLKFRSMRVDAERDGRARWATGSDDRITRVGRIIRKIRIDELPQIFNVLRGDMSFVGPRPERPEFVTSLADTIPYYDERHCVKPGITGWAQVCYPYGSSEKDALEKLQYDLYYVKNHSLLFDLMILLQTVEVVLLGKGGR
jgi:sugar transferase (PEP-CTERM system associated)